MTFNEALKKGIRRLRDPKWANPEAYLRIDVFKSEDGRNLHGPWFRLFERTAQERIGEPTPQTILAFSDLGDRIRAGEAWEEYVGPIDEEDQKRIPK